MTRSIEAQTPHELNLALIHNYRRYFIQSALKLLTADHYSLFTLIMKKLLTILGFLSFFALNSTEVKAQNYGTSLGLGLDFGDGRTFVGPSVRHHFSRNTALQAEVLFGGHTTVIQGFLQYAAPVKGAKGLEWYLGGGPKFQIYDRDRFFFVDDSYTAVYLVPMVGIDYKIQGAPLAIAFDWRPSIYIGDNRFLDSQPGRFGLGFRFTL